MSELAVLLALLRSHNVLTYEAPDGLKVTFGPAPIEFPKESLKEREEAAQREEEDVTFAHVE
jgi:hypothetical protein